MEIDRIKSNMMISTCSPEVQMGIKWLEGYLINKRPSADEAKSLFVLSKVKSPLVNEYKQHSKSDEFWPKDPWDLVELSNVMWCLAKLGLTNNIHFQEAYKEMKAMQTVEGRISGADPTHTGPLRVLVLLEPESETTKNAVKYLLDNLEYFNGIDELACGALALSELNYLLYKNKIRFIAEKIKSKQFKDGSWRYLSTSTASDIVDVIPTSWAVQAISISFGINDESLCKAIKWLKTLQSDDGSWGRRSDFTAYALLALMAAGEGPKIPLEIVEFNYMVQEQKIRNQKPHFVHTSPIFKGRQIKDIYDKILEMLEEAEHEIRISSLYIDMLYEKLIDLKSEKPDLEIRIITRPVEDLKRARDVSRKKIAKSTLNILPEVNIKLIHEPIAHARLIIIDSKEALISSADLTRDSLIDEFNAGIWTKDPETVRKAIEFFDNMWNYAVKRQRKEE